MGFGVLFRKTIPLKASADNQLIAIASLKFVSSKKP